jgi:hypothetical protein
VVVVANGELVPPHLGVDVAPRSKNKPISRSELDRFGGIIERIRQSTKPYIGVLPIVEIAGYPRIELDDFGEILRSLRESSELQKGKSSPVVYSRSNQVSANMDESYAIVVTTINYPTSAVAEITRNAGKLNASFFLVGDQKSPADFTQPGAIYLDLEAQRRTGFGYAALAPTCHYARKNVGYLAAIRDGASVIIETDDDNIPVEAFWSWRYPNVMAQVVPGTDWTNVYGYFSDRPIWPRGLPLNRVRESPPRLEATEEVYCPIQQGLADRNPDVDAIYRLVLPLPFDFRPEGPVALRGAWCPFNSQNTTWWREAFPLLYLPFYCSFRMTDIWRSFVAQKIAYLNGWGILFHRPTVYQERNEHDLLRDFEEEVPGYLHNGQIRQALDSLDLESGKNNIPTAMRACYRALVDLGVVGEFELPLLDAWLDDLAELGAC